MNHIVIISGPGGSGKDTIIAELLKDSSLHFKKLVNHTSRHPRAGEQNGVDYFFLTRDQYEHEIEHGKMLEYEVMESNNHYYGTHKEQLLLDLEASNVICKKMPAGSLKLKKYFGDRAITIFIDADDAELEHRLLEDNRASEHTLISRRIKQAHHEREMKSQFDFAITNHDGSLKLVVNEITSFVKKALTS